MEVSGLREKKSPALGGAESRIPCTAPPSVVLRAHDREYAASLRGIGGIFRTVLAFGIVVVDLSEIPLALMFHLHEVVLAMRITVEVEIAESADLRRSAPGRICAGVAGTTKSGFVMAIRS